MSRWSNGALCYERRRESRDPHSMKTMTCIEDLRQAARRKVPRAFFEYADGGAYSEQTLRAIISWARYGEAFAYDEDGGILSLDNPA